MSILITSNPRDVNSQNCVPSLISSQNSMSILVTHIPRDINGQDSISILMTSILRDINSQDSIPSFICR